MHTFLSFSPLCASLPIFTIVPFPPSLSSTSFIPPACPSSRPPLPFFPYHPSFPLLPFPSLFPSSPPLPLSFPHPFAIPPAFPAADHVATHSRHPRPRSARVTNTPLHFVDREIRTMMNFELGNAGRLTCGGQGRARERRWRELGGREREMDGGC